MTMIAIDTLKLARALKAKAQLSTEQAEGFADAFSEAIQDDLVTKTDLTLAISGLKSDLSLAVSGLKSDAAFTASELKSDLTVTASALKSDLTVAVSELKALLSDAKSDTIKWVCGMIGFQTIVTLGGVVALLKLAH